jgi:hypothetical protein
MNQQEIWRCCGESERKTYQISTFGNVRSMTKVNGKFKNLKLNPSTTGYLFITINGKGSAIAHLVAKAFIGDRPDGYHVDHIDRNRHNNRSDNLRYCSPAANNLNRAANGFGFPITDKERARLQEQCKKRRAIKIQCDCGSITDKHMKARHEKSKKHQNYLKTLQ